MTKDVSEKRRHNLEEGSITMDLSGAEDGGMLGGPMEWVDTKWNSSGEGGHLGLSLTLNDESVGSKVD